MITEKLRKDMKMRIYENLKRREAVILKIDEKTALLDEYFYTYATVPEQELDLLDLVKAALVFQFCPQDNEDLLKNKYTFEDMDITIKGNCIGMQDFRLLTGRRGFDHDLGRNQ